MKQQVTYLKKCLKCDNVEKYIMRDHNVNSDLTDKDIYMLIANDVKSPLDSDWCEKCKMHTLQMKVGWDYLSDEEKN